MSLHEFRHAYAALKASSAKRGEPRALFSSTLKATDDMRHRRLPYDPQDTLVSDATESQRIGCGAARLLCLLLRLVRAQLQEGAHQGAGARVALSSAPARQAATALCTLRLEAA